MCIFCQIVNGSIPTYKVYEDDSTLAFLDIHPVSAGHTLVISKSHYANLEDIPVEELVAVISSVKKVGQLLKDKLGVAGYNISSNNDPVAGQDIPHVHFHLIPRQSGDGLQSWPHHDYGPGKAEQILNKIIG